MYWYNSSGDPDQARFNMQSQYIDRRQVKHSLLNQNDAGIDNRTIDQAFDRGGSSTDPAVRQSSYTTIQREVNRQAYWIPLNYLPDLSTTDDRISNFVNSPGAGPEWNVYAWKATR
jgi:ABC-type transport system substrate-binding protein